MKAYQLLMEQGWVRGAFAVDGLGIKRDALDPRATRFDALGAIERCYPDLDKMGFLMIKLGSRVGNPSVWNDNTDFEEILKVLEEIEDNVGAVEEVCH